ncbi:MAG: hypothetical protein FJ290_06180, partial [Planctomycetes bacterium]|nr:hypothetical protein [Planctomycetota bacterium]
MRHWVLRIGGWVALVALLGAGCQFLGARPAVEQEPAPPFADDFASHDLSKWDYSEGKPAFRLSPGRGVLAPPKQTVMFGRREAMAAFTLRSEAKLPADDSRLHLRFLYAGKGNQWRGYLLSLTRKGTDPFTLQCSLQVSREEGKPVSGLGSQSLVFGTADDKRMEHWTKYAGAALAARWKEVARMRFAPRNSFLPVEVSVAGQSLSVSVNGLLVFSLPNELPAGGVQFELVNAAELASVRIAPPEPSGLFLPLDLAPIFNRDGITDGFLGEGVREGGDLGDGTALSASVLPPANSVARIEGVPFRMPSYADDALNVVDVGDSRWLESRDDGFRCRSYVGMRPGDGNPASLRLAVPRDWYRAAWLLCLATGKSEGVDTETVPEVTLRLGSFGYPFRL